MHLHLQPVFITFMYIQGDLRENVYIFNLIISVIVRKFRMNMCLSLNGYKAGTVWMLRTKSVRFLFVGLDEERSLK
jgi:hypothetical protein